MEPRMREAHRRPRNHTGEGPNWIFVTGSALLSVLSVRLGYKLKQILDAKQTRHSSPSLNVNVKSLEGNMAGGSCHLHSNDFCFGRDDSGCFNGYTGSRSAVEIAKIEKHSNHQVMPETELSLPLVTVPSSEFNRENGVMWSSSPDRLELPQKPFHQSNCSDSPCVSESGSDIFTKREVIQKLRQQLKRRDDMILEMQDQIAKLQSSLSTEISNSSHLQSLLDAANRNMFNSEREIHRLRNVIADHCVSHINPDESPPKAPLSTGTNGHVNGYNDKESDFGSSEKVREVEKIEMLKREVRELKELIEGKDYLIQSYKEQNCMFSMKIKELQQRLDSQVPNIL